MKNRLLSVILVFISLSMIWTFYSNAETRGEKKTPPGGHPSRMGPLPVDIYRVPPPEDIPVVLQYPARARSTGSVTVVARVSGFLQEMFFKEGQTVRKGDILFKIEPDTYQADLDSAKAALSQAISQLNKAERDYKRIKASYEDGVTSEQQRDAALSAYETAKAAVEVAKARLRQAELNLRYTDVRATISGITGMRHVDVGNYVRAGTVLVTITQPDPIYVEFSFPDSDLIKYNLGAGDLRRLKEEIFAELLIEGKTYPHRGKLDFIDIVLDAKSSTLKARAVFPNPEMVLFPGQFVRIKIRGLRKKGAIVVPQKAVIQSPLGAIVYLVRNGKVEARPVKIGDESGEKFIVEKGLQSGDMVIVDNLMKVRPGMPVKVDRIINREGK